MLNLQIRKSERFPEQICFVEGSLPYAFSSPDVQADLHKVFLEIAAQNQAGLGPSRVVVFRFRPAFSYDGMDPRHIQYLAQRALFDERLLLLLNARHLTHQLCFADFFSVFLFEDEGAFGSLFDFSLACDFRLCFSKRVFFGFPDISHDVFPFWGGFEKFVARGLRRRKDWPVSPILSATAAHDNELIDFLGSCSDTILTTETWIQENILRPKLVRKNWWKDARYSRIPTPKPFLLSDLREMQKRVGNVDRDGNRQASHMPSYHEGWTLLRHELSSVDLRLREYAMAEIVAAHDVDPQTLERQRSTGFRIRDLRLPSHQESPDRFVMLDVSFHLPPINGLLRLYAQGCVIGIHAQTEQRLVECLNILHARMVDQIGKDQVKNIWVDRLFWFVADHRLTSFVDIEWLPNEALSVREGTQAINAFFIGSQYSNADVGMIEVILEPIEGQNPDLKRLWSYLRMMCPRIVSCIKPHSTFRPSSVVRLLFLEFMLRLAAGYREKLDRIIKALAREGWGFVADPMAWDRFLRSREQIKLDGQVLRGVGDLSLSQRVLEVGSWKEVTELSFQQKLVPETWNDLEISRLLELAAARIGSELVRDGFLASYADSDALLMHALGYPSSAGLPQLVWREQVALAKNQTLLEESGLFDRVGAE